MIQQSQAHRILTHAHKPTGAVYRVQHPVAARGPPWGPAQVNEVEHCIYGEFRVGTGVLCEDVVDELGDTGAHGRVGVRTVVWVGV